MSATWGRKIKFTIFGESHGVAIGGVLEGIKPGTGIDFKKIDAGMKKRNHRAFYSTPRDEKDAYEILSGVKDGVTTGSPIGFVIRNEEQHSLDYVNLNETPRPGHADYPASVKYQGYNDYRGGGHFSGRITAPLTLAGSVARQVLEEQGVRIVSHIYSIGNVKSKSILDNPLNEQDIARLQTMEFPVLSEDAAKAMEEEIMKHKNNCDSVGGVVECAVYGINPGIGSPFFDSVESSISHMMFSIPAVKGIEFGRGFDIAAMSGFEANDSYRADNGRIVAESNNNGGILGGITNGMPIVFRVAVKPTPSIFKTQNTVNLTNLTNTEITLKGRHDVCIVPRAAAVVEAGTALCLLDLQESDQI